MKIAVCLKRVPDTTTKIENLILTRARELKLAAD